MSELSQSEREELEQLRKQKAQKGTLHLKVSPKGALSLYGLGRFPVTLYRGQWEKVINFIEQIKEFIKDHDSQLKTKE